MHVGSSGCRVKPRSGPPGFHTTTRELQTCTFQGPGASNTTKIPRKDPEKRGERKKIVTEKKSAKFWAPRAPDPSGPPPFWTPPFWAPPFWPPLFPSLGLHPSGRHSSGPHPPPTRWPKQVRLKQVNTFTGLNGSDLNRLGLNRSGLNRSNWPEAVLAKIGAGWPNGLA